MMKNWRLSQSFARRHALCWWWLRAGCCNMLQMCLMQVPPTAPPSQNRNVPLVTRGRVYSTCVRSVMLHAAETWAMTAVTLNRLRQNDRAMIRWICNVKAKDQVSSDSLLSKLGIQDLEMVLRTSGMRWFGHVERSTGWIAKVRKLNVVAQKRPGRPKKTWDEVLVEDRKKLGMDFADPMNHSEWRGRLRGRLVKQAQP